MWLFGKQYKKRLVVFDYLESKEPITIEFKSEETSDTISYVEDKVNEIRSNKNPDRSVGYWCKYMCVGKDRCDQLWAASLLKRNATNV